MVYSLNGFVDLYDLVLLNRLVLLIISIVSLIMFKNMVHFRGIVTTVYPFMV